MDKMEKLKNYKDRFPFLEFRKRVMLYQLIFTDVCFKIIKDPKFEMLSLIIILANSITMAMDDPLDKNPN